jgi:hypothetical protein
MVKFASLFVVGENHESQQFTIIESLERVVQSFSLKAKLLNEVKNPSNYSSKIPQTCKYVCLKVKITP